MAIRYYAPGIVVLGLVLTAALVLAGFFIRKRKVKRRTGIRVANTGRLRALPMYRKKKLESRILKILTVAGVCTGIVAALFLTARPYRRDTVRDDVSSRDIAFCLDLSSSSCAGEKAIVQQFEEMVSQLDGDRIGVTLFNTSAMQYVPMTDDYDFVTDRLQELEEYLDAEEEFTRDYTDVYDSVYDIPEDKRDRYEELNAILAAFDAGTTAGYQSKGTSVIGEGLASCLFNFPQLHEEKRTRILILVTDNQDECIGDPLVTLTEAAGMCEEDDVILFGIYPGDEVADSGTGAGQTAVQKTPGAEAFRETLYTDAGRPASLEAMDTGTQLGILGAVSRGTLIETSSEESKTSSEDSQMSPEGSETSSGDSEASSDSAERAQDKEAMRSAVESAGGTFYEEGAALSAQDILAAIQQQARETTKTVVSTRDSDEPGAWFIVLAIAFGAAAACTVFILINRLRQGGFRDGTSFGNAAGHDHHESIRGKRVARSILSLLLIAAMTACVIIIGIRPRRFDPDAEISTNNLNVCFVVDTTISMWAEDYGNSKPRMDGVRDDIDRIMDALPDSYFALMRFDNGAQILAPFTQDFHAIEESMDELKMPGYSTAEGSSMNTVYGALKSMLGSSAKKDRKTIVFLFSDGEITDGSTLRSFDGLGSLVDDGAVLGYGTAAGGRMYYEGRGYIQDSTTRTDARSVINETNLKQLASDLGIEYIHETGRDTSAMTATLGRIRMLSAGTARQQGDLSGFSETYYYFAGALALCLIGWLFLLVYRGGSR